MYDNAFFIEAFMSISVLTLPITICGFWFLFLPFERSINFDIGVNTTFGGIASKAYSVLPSLWYIATWSIFSPSTPCVTSVIGLFVFLAIKRRSPSFSVCNVIGLSIFCILSPAITEKNKSE